MQFYVDQNILSCCATAVFKGTDLVDHQTFGYMDLETRQPLRDDGDLSHGVEYQDRHFGCISDVARSGLV